jgi:gas vesicle protein
MTLKTVEDKMDEYENSGSGGGFLSGLIVGLIAGSVIALLTAPQSGEETRQLIGEKSLELREKAAESIDEVLLQAERAMASARETTDHTIERTKRQILQFESRGEKMLEEQRQRFNRIVEEARNREQQA